MSRLLPLRRVADIGDSADFIAASMAEVFTAAGAVGAVLAGAVVLAGAAALAGAGGVAGALAGAGDLAGAGGVASVGVSRSGHPSALAGVTTILTATAAFMTAAAI
ncbi:MAG: hypothetical protein BGO16_02660 [Nitrobacter sp. 62-23]|nr:MAG: hypothetical protein BGO16_02660 [Nitrobacter sp. 62-23]